MIVGGRAVGSDQVGGWGQVGEVEADSKEEEKARKKDTENARTKSGDWSVTKMWWLLGEEA